ncbi:MAG TPA: serine hydrolase domain-containing protein [Thermoanaerobaculia bacterium]|jgi:CubicO group peptidase (beta-lactamase class C family)|nr:serine hydrolase domain-containing protein [Thermoanaerobaculia bacterium]
MRRLLIVVLLLAPLAMAQPRRRASGPAIPTALIDPIAAKALADGAPAVSIAIGRGDSILFAAGYGTASANTIYQAGSVSKQFAAAAMMLLVERGAVSLGDPVEKYVPAMAGKGMTIRQLLSHTSGLTRDIPNLTSAYAPISEADAVARIAAAKTLFQPGAGWSYSNAGYYLVAVVIEKASGKPYAQFLDEELLLPLGLASTAVCGSTPRVPTPDGYLLMTATKQVVPVRAADMSLLLGAGDVCSTATDLARWSHALATGRAVTPASYEEMTRPRASISATATYGFGLLMDLDRGNPVVLHDGLVLGFQTILIHYPDQDLTIAVVVNAIDDTLAWVPATTAGIQIGQTLVPAH